MKRMNLNAEILIPFKIPIRTLSLILVISLMGKNLIGQTTKNVFFSMYYLSVYQRPMMMPSGKWDAMYENMGWTNTQGKITVDETNKIIIITFSNGENRTIKNIKKEIKGSFIDEKGIVQTLYRGVLATDMTEAKLEITETKNSECTIKYCSNRIIDSGVVISGQEVKFNDYECYKNIVLFSTNGKCLE